MLREGPTAPVVTFVYQPPSLQYSPPSDPLHHSDPPPLNMHSLRSTRLVIREEISEEDSDFVIISTN